MSGNERTAIERYLDREDTIDSAGDGSYDGGPDTDETESDDANPSDSSSDERSFSPGPGDRRNPQPDATPEPDSSDDDVSSDPSFSPGPGDRRNPQPDSAPEPDSSDNSNPSADSSPAAGTPPQQDASGSNGSPASESTSPEPSSGSEDIFDRAADVQRSRFGAANEQVREEVGNDEEVGGAVVDAVDDNRDANVGQEDLEIRDGEVRFTEQAQRDQAASQLESQLEEQVGAGDLDRGEDFVVETTDNGVRAELTDSFTQDRREAAEQGSRSPAAALGSDTTAEPSADAADQTPDPGRITSGEGRTGQSNVDGVERVIDERVPEDDILAGLPREFRDAGRTVLGEQAPDQEITDDLTEGDGSLPFTLTAEERANVEEDIEQRRAALNFSDSASSTVRSLTGSDAAARVASGVGKLPGDVASATAGATLLTDTAIRTAANAPETALEQGGDETGEAIANSIFSGVRGGVEAFDERPAEVGGRVAGGLAAGATASRAVRADSPNIDRVVSSPERRPTTSGPVDGVAPSTGRVDLPDLRDSVGRPTATEIRGRAENFRRSQMNRFRDVQESIGNSISQNRPTDVVEFDDTGASRQPTDLPGDRQQTLVADDVGQSVEAQTTRPDISGETSSEIGDLVRELAADDRASVGLPRQRRGSPDSDGQQQGGGPPRDPNPGEFDLELSQRRLDRASRREVEADETIGQQANFRERAPRNRGRLDPERDAISGRRQDNGGDGSLIDDGLQRLREAQTPEVPGRSSTFGTGLATGLSVGDEADSRAATATESSTDTDVGFNGAGIDSADGSIVSDSLDNQITGAGASTDVGVGLRLNDIARDRATGTTTTDTGQQTTTTTTTTGSQTTPVPTTTDPGGPQTGTGTPVTGLIADPPARPRPDDDDDRSESRVNQGDSIIDGSDASADGAATGFLAETFAGFGTGGLNVETTSAAESDRDTGRLETVAEAENAPGFEAAEDLFSFGGER